MRINYDFGDLEAFLAVKETGSFHLAAEQLNLSQSAVTRRVQKLEDALNSQLFHRSTRSVKPTLAAKRLEGRARAILEDAAETSQAMRDESVAFSYQRSAVVTVAIVPTLTAGILAPAVDQLEQPIRLQILDGSANEVAESVADGEADFGLCSLPSLDPNTRFERLFEEEIGAVMRETNTGSTEHELDWNDLENQPLILPARGTGNRLLIDEARAKANLPMSWTFETRRSTTALDLVATGQGVALLPKSAMAAAEGRSLVFRNLSGLKITRPVGILAQIGQAETKSALALKDAIRSVAKD